LLIFGAETSFPYTGNLLFQDDSLRRSVLSSRPVAKSLDYNMFV